jgi:hypothetical protein
MMISYTGLFTNLRLKIMKTKAEYKDEGWLFWNLGVGAFYVTNHVITLTARTEDELLRCLEWWVNRPADTYVFI